LRIPVVWTPPSPWREWDLTSRTKLIEFAEQHQIPVAKDKRGEAPFSVDANLLHTSSEGKVLEDPAVEAPDYVYQRTVAPEDAPNEPEFIEIGFERGDAVSINGEMMSPATVLTKLSNNCCALVRSQPVFRGPRDVRRRRRCL